MAYRVMLQREIKCVCLIDIKNKSCVRNATYLIITADYVYLWRRAPLVTVDGTLIKTSGTSSYSRLCMFTTGGIYLVATDGTF
jgi:hypothetical protein